MRASTEPRLSHTHARAPITTHHATPTAELTVITPRQLLWSWLVQKQAEPISDVGYEMPTSKGRAQTSPTPGVGYEMPGKTALGRRGSTYAGSGQDDEGEGGSSSV